MNQLDRIAGALLLVSCSPAEERAAGSGMEECAVRFLDADQDGFGNPEQPTTACESQDSLVDNSRDCNDDDASVRPDGVWEGDLVSEPTTVGQDDLSSFASGCYGQIAGDVRIYGTDLTDLHALRSVAVVNGSVEIRGNFFLEDAAGLENIAEIGGSLDVSDNPIAVLSMPALERLGGGLTLSLPLAQSTDLQSLAEIPGQFLLTLGADLAGLDGLSGLQQIGDRFDIDAVGLKSLEGLENLREVGGRLTITNAHALTDLRGLSGLRTIGGDLVLSSMDGLGTLAGLERLEVVPGELALSRLPALTDLSALGGVSRTGRLSVLQLASLTDLHGLEAMASVDESVRLSELPSLRDVDGLVGLRTIGDGLSLYEDTALEDLGGLYGLLEVGTILYIHDNPALPEQEVEALIAAIGEQNIGIIDTD